MREWRSEIERDTKRERSTLKKAASGPLFSYTLPTLPMAIIILCMLGVIIACPGSRSHVKNTNHRPLGAGPSQAAHWGYYWAVRARHARLHSAVHALVRVAE